MVAVTHTCCRNPIGIRGLQFAQIYCKSSEGQLPNLLDTCKFASRGFSVLKASIDPRVPNTLIRKDYSLVNFTNIFPVSTQGMDLSNSQ